MPLLFCDSHRHYGNGPNFNGTAGQQAMEKYAAYPVTHQAAGGSDGGPYLAIADAGEAVAYVGDQSVVTVGAWLLYTSAPNNVHQPRGLALIDNATAWLQLYTGLDPTGRLFVARGGGPILGTAADVLPLHTWVHVELRAVLAPTATGSVELRVNGTAVTTATAVRTAESSAVAGRAGVKAAAGLGGLLFQYPTVTDGDFLGRVWITATRPATTDAASTSTIAGTTPAATRHASIADPTPDYDTTTLSLVAGDRDWFGVREIPGDGGTAVRAVQLVALARHDAAVVDPANPTPNRYGPSLRFDGTAVDGTAVQQATFPIARCLPVSAHPGTAAPLTLADVNACEIGHRRESAGTVGHVLVTQLVLEVVAAAPLAEPTAPGDPDPDPPPDPPPVDPDPPPDPTDASGEDPALLPARYGQGYPRGDGGAGLDALAADVTAHGLVLDDHEDRIADLEAAGPGGGGGGGWPFKPLTAPVNADFSWINETYNGITTTVIATASRISLGCPIDTLNPVVMRGRKLTAGISGNRIITAGFACEIAHGTFAEVGIAIGDSAGKWMSWAFSDSGGGNRLLARNWNSTISSPGSASGPHSLRASTGPVIYLRIEDDGTNLKLWHSFTGESNGWTLMNGAVSRTAFLNGTMTDVLFYVMPWGSRGAQMTLVHWEVT